MAAVLSLLSGIWGAVTAALGWGKQRDAEANTAAMVANAEARKAQSERDADAEALAKGTLDEVRRRSS